MAETRVYTIGHSTHPIDEFILMLKATSIERLIDVRTVAGSRYNPQFGERELAASMTEAGIDYQRLEALGGLRHSPVAVASINGAWRNRSFRSYADYMQTSEFVAGIEKLIAVAKKQTVAIMCAEALPWRCHRSLIGDALLARGLQVIDIMSRTSAKPHTMTDFANVDGELVWYPEEHLPKGANAMTQRFSVGDHVRWNSEAGYVEGTITKVHTKDVDYKGHTHRCSPEEPQYEITSDTTDHIAMHKGAALTKI